MPTLLCWPAPTPDASVRVAVVVSLPAFCAVIRQGALCSLLSCHELAKLAAGCTLLWALLHSTLARAKAAALEGLHLRLGTELHRLSDATEIYWPARRLTLADFAVLAACAPSLNGLRCIQLPRTDLSSALGLRALCTLVLRASSSLHTLNLDACQLGETGTRALAAAINGSSHGDFRRLDLVGPSCHGATAACCGAGLVHLRVLHLAHNAIGDEACVALFHALAQVGDDLPLCSSVQMHIAASARLSAPQLPQAVDVKTPGPAPDWARDDAGSGGWCHPGPDGRMLTCIEHAGGGGGGPVPSDGSVGGSIPSDADAERGWSHEYGAAGAACMAARMINRSGDEDGLSAAIVQSRDSPAPPAPAPPPPPPPLPPPPLYAVRAATMPRSEEVHAGAERRAARPKLHSLDLCGNGLSDRILLALTSAGAAWHELRVLALGNNSLGGGGCGFCELGRALKWDMPLLETLYLDKNCLRTADVRSLADALADGGGPSLRQLDVRWQEGQGVAVGADALASLQRTEAMGAHAGRLAIAA